MGKGLSAGAFACGLAFFAGDFGCWPNAKAPHINITVKSFFMDGPFPQGSFPWHLILRAFERNKSTVYCTRRLALAQALCRYQRFPGRRLARRKVPPAQFFTNHKSNGRTTRLNLRMSLRVPAVKSGAARSGFLAHSLAQIDFAALFRRARFCDVNCDVTMPGSPLLTHYARTLQKLLNWLNLFGIV
jgi:hypothetical protein